MEVEERKIKKFNGPHHPLTRMACPYPDINQPSPSLASLFPLSITPQLPCLRSVSLVPFHSLKVASPSAAGRTGGRYEKSEGVAMPRLLRIGGFEEMNGPGFNDTFRNGCHYSRNRRFIRGVVSFVVQYQSCLAVRYLGEPRNFSVRQVIYHHKSFTNHEVVILSRTASDESRGQQACCHTIIKISNRNRRPSGIHS